MSGKVLHFIGFGVLPVIIELVTVVVVVVAGHELVRNSGFVGPEWNGSSALFPRTCLLCNKPVLHNHPAPAAAVNMNRNS